MQQSLLVQLPSIGIALYFVLAVVAFTIDGALRGVRRDAEIEARGRSVLVGWYLRNYFVWVTMPLQRLLLASGVSANAVTALAAVLGVASGVLVAGGWFAAGGWLFLFSGILDAMDGRIARARGQVSPAGAFVDSVLDRYVDAALLMGLGWYFRGTWVLAAALVALAGTMLVPYVRARAEALGVPMREGLMQRTERMLYLGGAVVLSPVLEALVAPTEPRPLHRLAAAGIVFIAVTSNATALGRFRSVFATLTAARTDRGQTSAEPALPGDTSGGLRSPYLDGGGRTPEQTVSGSGAGSYHRGHPGHLP